MATHSSTLAWKIPTDGGAWWAAVHGVARSRTRLSDFTFSFHFLALARMFFTTTSTWEAPIIGTYVLYLEKRMALHSSTLAWKIPWMEEPGGLQSMGLLRVRHY